MKEINQEEQIEKIKAQKKAFIANSADEILYWEKLTRLQSLQATYMELKVKEVEASIKLATLKYVENAKRGSDNQQADKSSEEA